MASPLALADSSRRIIVLTVSAELGTVLEVLLDVIPSLEDYKNKHGEFDCEIRMIVHQGCIIGRAGFKVKELREVPSSPAEWQEIAQQFAEKWNFPNCIGALDGKHIQLRAPNQGSHYFNHLGYHSIILLAMVDANYKFIFVDVGANGRAGNAGIFSESALAEGLENVHLAYQTLLYYLGGKILCLTLWSEMMRLV